MTDFAGQSMNGFLLESRRGSVSREHLAGSKDTVFVTTVERSRWEEYQYTSPRPLRGEDDDSRPPYVYSLLVRRSGARFLLVAPTRAVVEHFLSTGNRTATFCKVPIDVDGLVKRLVERPAEYGLSFAHARLPAFGIALRSISLYGEDLGAASFFRDNLDLMTFFTCGLRPVASGAEVARIGAEGTLSFHLGRTTLNAVEEAMAFLRREGYIKGQLWGE